MSGWIERQRELLDLAQRQLFFVGGAPRSGTTWLQYLLDQHPDIRCCGEGLLMKHLAEPLDVLFEQRRQVLRHKNDTVFRHSGGFLLPGLDETDLLVGTAVLLALQRQCANGSYRAVGEKTPENVFFFPRVKRIFPTAKFIGIARDPRDVLSSAWHFFHRSKAAENDVAAKAAFIRHSLPSLNQGARAMLALAAQYPSDSITITYEGLLETTVPTAARLFRFLGVSDLDDVVAACVARTSFAALSGGRRAGIARDGSFFRKGVAGDWHATLTPEMNEMILRELGWMFPLFGWKP